MLKKIFKLVFENRYQILKYLVTGGSGFVLDIATLWLLKEKFGFTPTQAVIANQIFMVSYLFLFYKFWAFRARGITHSQLIRFVCVLAWDYIFSVLMMALGTEILSFNYLLVRTATIAINTLWNYPLYKYFVFVENRVGIKDLISHLKSFLKP